MNKVADKIMPKEIAKIAPYLSMVAPFMGIPMGMFGGMAGGLGLQALSDAKTYGKVNYGKLALQAAMQGMAKSAKAGKATTGEKAFMRGNVTPGADVPGANVGGWDPSGEIASRSPHFAASTYGDLAAPTAGMNAAQGLASANPDAFKAFKASDAFTKPGWTSMEGLKSNFGDMVTTAGRKMYNPINFSDGLSGITGSLLEKGRIGQAMALGLPLSLYAGMDATDKFKMAGGAGTGGGAVNQNALTQSNYDLANLYGQNAGYTQDEINTIYGPTGAMYGGEYNEIQGDPNQWTRRQFPGTNYPIHTTHPNPWEYAKDGGRIGYKDSDPEGVQPEGEGMLFVEPPMDADGREIVRDPSEMGIGSMALEAIGNLIRGADFDEGGYSFPRHPNKIRKSIYDLIGLGPSNYPGFDDLTEFYQERANGGRVGLAGGGGPEWGSYKDWLESSDLLEKYPELEGMTPDEQQNFLEGIGLLRANGGRIHKNIGGVMNAPAFTTPGQPMMPPQNTQWDGRTGGFMPMGAKPRADDVPAMLSKDEFVMTRDAVKGMGGGDPNVGAQKMYDLMNSLEARV